MTDTNQKLREALQAFAKRGTGFDSCPTRRLPQSDEAKQIDQWWLRYFMDADLSVRSLARQALAMPTDTLKVESERESIAKYFDQYPGREFFGTTVADLIRNKHGSRDCGNCAHFELRSQDEPCRQCIDNYNIFDSEFVHWEAME